VAGAVLLLNIFVTSFYDCDMLNSRLISNINLSLKNQNILCGCRINSHIPNIKILKFNTFQGNTTVDDFRNIYLMALVLFLSEKFSRSPSC
jgi:hypothetical protein